MPKSYSAYLHERVIEAVASGISRYEAAELCGLAVSTQPFRICFHMTGIRCRRDTLCHSRPRRAF